MRPAKHILSTFILASLLSGCSTIPESLWSSGEQAPEKPVVTEQPKEPAKPKPPASLHQQIEMDLLSNRLSKPSGNNAIEKIERLRRMNPDDPAIAKYEKEVINRYLLLADRRLKKNNPPTRRDLEVALKYINTARSLQVPSDPLDKKEQVILELLDIVVQQEQLEKERAASANQPAAQEPAPTTEADTPETLTEVAPPPAEEQTPMSNNPNFLNLKQSQIDARSQEINLQLDSISPRIISENAAVIIHARSMDDFRYLSASLRTSLYWVDPDFVVTAEPHISPDVNPGVEIISY